MSTGRSLAAGTAIVAIGSLTAYAISAVRLPPLLEQGSPAPDFEVRTIDAAGATRRLGDFPGEVMLLNVWATWCIPCQREMPRMQRLYREFGGHGLRVVAVSIDDGGAQASIREFADEFGLTFDILHDPMGTIMQTYQMVGVPQSFLIDSDGIIRKKTFETDWYSDENRALVAELLERGSGRRAGG